MKRSLLVLGLIACAFPTLAAQDAPPLCCSFDDLAHRGWCELEQIYRQAKPGKIPCGFARGKAIYCPSEPLAHCRESVTGLLWHGKHFCDGMLINQWTGVRAIRAKVDYGTSWLDGQPAIILDYHCTSRLWHDVRDEMREVCPGLYVGAMYVGQCPCAKLKVFFVLETTCCSH